VSSHRSLTELGQGFPPRSPRLHAPSRPILADLKGEPCTVSDPPHGQSLCSHSRNMLGGGHSTTNRWAGLRTVTRQNSEVIPGVGASTTSTPWRQVPGRIDRESHNATRVVANTSHQFLRAHLFLSRGLEAQTRIHD
jgi:hypothetical protein